MARRHAHGLTPSITWRVDRKGRIPLTSKNGRSVLDPHHRKRRTGRHRIALGRQSPRPTRIRETTVVDSTRTQGYAEPMTSSGVRTPRVTIAIPTFNRLSGYFPQALASALAQDYENLEVLVCDNASTDGTDMYMSSVTDERLRYLRHAHNIGAHANFNACVDNAAGEYLVLLHDDDLLDADFISSCMSALGEARGAGTTDVGVIRTGSRVIDARGSVRSENRTDTRGLSDADVMVRWFERKTPLYMASTLYNTAELKAIGGFSSPHGLYQDVKATAILMARHGRVDVDEVLASFRRHADNRGTSVRAVEWAEDALHLLDVLVTEFPTKREELRRLGSVYLCEKCLRVASGIPAAKDRWQAYRQVAALFDGSVSPLRFETKRIVRLLRARLRSQVKRLMAARAVTS